MEKVTSIFINIAQFFRHVEYSIFVGNFVSFGRCRGPQLLGQSATSLRCWTKLPAIEFLHTLYAKKHRYAKQRKACYESANEMENIQVLA